MKNPNMKRNVDHGRKNLFFEDVKVVARFVNLYKDLFINGNFRVEKWVTSRGIIYNLTFLMNHKDMEEIRKSIKTVKRSFSRKDLGSNYRYTREFVII